MSETIKYLIKVLNLEPHPEGGYFRETYRSTGEIVSDCLDPEYQGSRNYSTSIYFLLTSDQFSAFHKIRQDEIWHFYEGSPIELHMISKEGEYTCEMIGRNIEAGENLQFVVPGGVWFASRVSGSNEFSLVGCTVSPGFDFKDFELANPHELLSSFPQHKEIISILTRS